MTIRSARKPLWFFIAISALVAGVSGVSMVFTQVSATDTHGSPAPRVSPAEITPELPPVKIVRVEPVLGVTASGTLRPLQTLPVCSEVSGTVKRVLKGAGERVKKDEVIAIFVPELRESERQNAGWQKQHARRQLLELPVERRNQQLKEERLKVALERKKVALARARSVLELATIERKRVEFLVRKEIVSQGELDVRKLTEANAQHDLQLMELDLADCGNDLKQIDIDKAGLAVREEFWKSDLSENVNDLPILAPIDGVILEQFVTPGQTISAAFQTPTLFKIASDLSEMLVEARVAEADFAKIKKGQRVNFEVSARPGETFSGVVTAIGLQGDGKTFPVTIAAKNPVTSEQPFGQLLPGMTATVRF